MNIGIVTTWFERGAAYVSRQFAEILEQENNVFIYARGGESYAKGDPKWDCSNVTWGKRINSPFVATVIHKKDFLKWIRKHQIELIIFNEQHWFQPLLWCKKLGIKTIAYIDYYTERTIPLFDIYDALICNTHRHKQAFSTHPNAYYVPWGTDIELFKPAHGGLVSKDYVTFFHSAGVSGHRKGTDLFIRALSLMKCKDFKAVIHTQKPLLVQFPELSNIIADLEREGRLEVITKTVTAPGLYHLGDVYVYPSRLEGIGLTIAESISCGLACIVPNNGPMNEFVEDSFGSKVPIERYYARADGYYWPKCECFVEELAKTMDEYACNIERVLDCKIQARAYAKNHLSHTKNFKALNTFVKKTEFSPISMSTENSINSYDNFGLKRLQKYYLKLQLYRLLGK